MILKNPASDLANELDAETVGGVALTLGDNLFAVQKHPRPMGLVVELLNTGGEAPQPFLSPTASAYFQATVQVLIWGDPGEDGFVSGEALARGVLGFAQQLIPSGYVSFLSVSSAPLYLGVDPDTQRHTWSLNLTARYTA